MSSVTLLGFIGALSIMAITACCDSTTSAKQQSNSINQATHVKAQTSSNPQKPQSTDTSPATELYGIDISHFQGQVDWEKVAQQDIDFAFIKASQGRHTVDHQYKRNWAQARQTRLLLGAYHYLDPSLNAVEQADHFFNVTQGDFGNFPPIVDIEAFERANAQEVIETLNTFIVELEKKSGCKPIIYTFSYFWDQLDNHKFGAYKLWLADYTKHPTIPNGWTKWTFLQFETNSSIAGINGNVDRNKYIGNLSQLGNLACKKSEMLNP